MTSKRMTDEELKSYLNNLFPLPSREDVFHYTYEDRGEFIKTEILCRLEEGEKAKAEIDRLTRVIERIKQAMCYEQCDEDKLIEIQRILSED